MSGRTQERSEAAAEVVFPEDPLHVIIDAPLPLPVTGVVAIAGEVDVNIVGPDPLPVTGVVAIAGEVDVNIVGPDPLPVTLVGGLAGEAASFTATFDRISPVTATVKYMATLFNTSAIRKVVLQRICVFNWQVTGVPGIILEQEFRRIAARTAGVAVPIVAEDTADVLSAGISADTASTLVTDADLILRVMATNEEIAVVGTQAESFIVGARTMLVNAVLWEKKPGTRGIVLRANQGITIKSTTPVVPPPAAVGSVSYLFEFTDEAA